VSEREANERSGTIPLGVPIKKLEGQHTLAFFLFSIFLIIMENSYGNLKK